MNPPMNNKKIRIFIIDDHKILKDSMITLLTGQNPDTLSPEEMPGRPDNNLTFVCTADSYNQLFERLEQMADKIDVLLLDINLPEQSGGHVMPKEKLGLQAVAQIRKDYPHLKIIIMTQINDPGTIADALKIGVDGYISKDMGKKEYLEGIKRVMDGQMVIQVPGNFLPLSSTHEITLTDMEKQVLQLTVDGLNAGEISSHLGITQPNVERYLRILRKKFAVSNMASLVREAIGKGFYP